MTEAARVVLVRDRDPPVAADRGQPVGDVVLALVAQAGHEGVVGLEVALDRRLAPARHDDDVVDPGTERLVDDDLDRRRVTDRHQFLRDRLGHGEEPGAQTCGGDDSGANVHVPECTAAGKPIS